MPIGCASPRRNESVVDAVRKRENIRCRGRRAFIDSAPLCYTPPGSHSHLPLICPPLSVHGICRRVLVWKVGSGRQSIDGSAIVERRVVLVVPLVRLKRTSQALKLRISSIARACVRLVVSHVEGKKHSFRRSGTQLDFSSRTTCSRCVGVAKKIQP